MHYKEFHTAAGKKQEWHQANDIDRENEPLPEKCQKIISKKRERHQIYAVGSRSQPRCGEAGKEEHQKQIGVLVELRENHRTGELDGEKYDHHQSKGKQGITQPLDEPVPPIADT